ncbi:MAG: ATP-dependent helicase [Desulfovibrio sp.]|jgi:DNA helicase-2/ATP-dependent DNA helicase PcrA|nr:ATP-dependent helicase [Desulfovibrio sp.]
MIDYERDLNEAQFEAAASTDGPLLVVAGAGSGKTRTIVYRLAYLVESGIPASSILLLTFTRKAAVEMLERARRLAEHSYGLPKLSSSEPLLDPRPFATVQGGTFHSYAYSILRIFRPQGYSGNLTIMDNHDILAAFQHCREELKIGKGDRSFPKNQTVNALLSKSRNKEMPLEDALRRDAPHLFMHHSAMEELTAAYARYKREKSLLDYDDLLFSLEEVLLTRPEALAYCRGRHKYIMVDEYQDTNPVQARIAGLVAGLDPPAQRKPEGTPDGFRGNLMAVGDDAQSIYAFRGADIRNILDFPKIFKGTKIIRLEENYRSTQHLLNLSNAVLENAAEGYAKHLFTRRGDGLKPNIVRPLSDRSQAAHAAARIIELMRSHRPGDIAVLFRSGFHSFPLEVTLNKLGIAFKKYGGVRYTEAAHVRDVLSFLRLVLNPMDFTAFCRMAELSRGVGVKTCLKIYQTALSGDGEKAAEMAARHPELAGDLAFLENARRRELTPVQLLTEIIEHYTPRMELLYPDDYPRRAQGLEQLIQIAAAYKDPDLLAVDLSLEDPENREEGAEALTLSTIHSAKGLEWNAVLILDLVEERFPSRHAMVRPEDYEEERRLMYVACTRARTVLELYVPSSLYDRSGGGTMPASPSPFVRELSPSLYRELQEGWDGALSEKRRPAPGNRLGGNDFSRPPPVSKIVDFHTHAARNRSLPHEDDNAAAEPEAPPVGPDACGFCRHRIFGRGKIVQHLPPDKVRVNFPGFGLKVIMASYLSMEDG